ncbi:MAG: DUF5674 family protein [Candidatus Zixiibacteriota bacterium]
MLYNRLEGSKIALSGELEFKLLILPSGVCFVLPAQREIAILRSRYSSEHRNLDAELTMQILTEPITRSALATMAAESFLDMVKAVVDIQRELIAVDAEMHADLEALLLDNGSSQENLWGINFYPALRGIDFLEFDSMINLRPSLGNVSRGVDDEGIRHKIAAVVEKWVKP